ncbi:MAG: NAD-dependent protein deacylase [Candidatus Aminicenantes bacterium]|nr:NAD-dependent protein deacylase [Candidatus Aminicenantes bacterium]
MAEKFETGPLFEVLQGANRVAVLTGAGISAESGIPTFRGEEGLWKKYRPEELATPAAFSQDPKLVWEWYDWRRGIIGQKEPNPGHEVIARWEGTFPTVSLITQNIDGLHQKAGSKNVWELHGNIWKLRCTEEGTITENYDIPLKEIPPLCSNCRALLRPHVVWYGESLSPTILRESIQLSSECDVMFVIGTSAVVQPAASLPFEASEAGAKIVEINLDPTPLSLYADFSIRGKSGEILPLIDEELKKTSKA